VNVSEIMSGPHIKSLAGDQSCVIAEPLRPVPLPWDGGMACQGWNTRREQWLRKRGQC